MKYFIKERLWILGMGVCLLLFSTSFLFAGAQQEKVEAPTLIWLTTVQGGQDAEEEPIFEKDIEKLTGVKVKVIKIPGEEYLTKMTAMLATGEPVDIVYLLDFQFDALWDQDVFEPLTDRIMSSKVLSDPEIIPMSEWDRIRRDDGHIYGVFNKFEQGTLPIVRADWMEKLGFAPPETFDEYYELLKAFTVQDPDGNGKDDTFGLALGYTIYESSGFFGAYGFIKGYAKDAAGNLYAPHATEKAIPVYEWLARLYREGILEPNFVTNKSSNFRDLFMTDKAGMTCYWAAWVGMFNQQVKAKNPNSPFKARGIAPPKGPGGRLLRAGSDGLMVIPNYSKHKDLAFKILEFWHTQEGCVLSCLGHLGHDYNIVDGKYVITEIGKAHAGHSAPQPKSLKWKNPFGEMEGFEEAAEIIRKYALPEMVTPYGTQWETIVRSEAAKIILGDISAEQGVENMQRRFKEEGVYK